MTNKDRITLQKTSDYICDVAQFIEGFSFEQFMNDKKQFLPVPLPFLKSVNWQRM